MSRPEEEVAADLRLQAMMAEMEQREEEPPTEEEILQMRADMAISGKSAEEENIAAMAQEMGTPEIETPEMVPNEPVMLEDPFAQYAQDPPAYADPFAIYAPAGTDIEDPNTKGMPKLSDFPEERGTSRASIQLPEMASLEAGLGMFLPETDVRVSIDEEALENMGGWEAAAQASSATGQPFMPPIRVDGLGQLAQNFGMSMATLSMTDPQEIVDTMTQQVEFENPTTGEMESAPLFPGVSYMVAPDGALILVNNARKDSKGQPLMALVNRPGFSMMDALQIVNIGAMYTPTGRIATVASAGARQAALKATSETARRLAVRKARSASAKAMMAGSAVTETAIQAGHGAVGGEFNKGEIALSTAFGVVPDYVFDPLIRLGTKIPSYLMGKIPASETAALANKTGAMEYADQTGRRLMTQDVLQERITPPMAIFAKIVERIPVVGTGRARKRMVQERIDSLTELAAEYGIDVNTNYGTRVMESFVERMTNQRFWGKQQEMLENIPMYGAGSKTGPKRAEEMMRRAWEKEAAEITDGVLKTAIKNNQIDDTIVDGVMKSNKLPQMTDLFNKLTPEGQKAAKQRFLLNGLEEATWHADAPGVANPQKFMQYLNAPTNRKILEAWFDPTEREMLTGMREYLRLSASAEKTAAGAGMVAAVGGGASWIAGMLEAFVGVGAFTAGAGHAYQSNFVRNRLLQLAHTKGNENQTRIIMDALRPYMLAAEKQWKQNNYEFPEVNISRESLKDAGKDLLDYGVDRIQEGIGEIGQVPANVLDFLSGEDQSQN
jgi:hypothetical protein